MISIYKLEKLHRAPRLRKIASILAAAERAAQQGTPKDLAYLSEITGSLSRDPLFDARAAQALAETSGILARTATAKTAPDEAAGIRRALNGARHILLAETGQSQADWDFTDGEGRLDAGRRRVFRGMAVYLEDIRSPFNVGAMFRTAESFGAERILVSPFCADPNHPRARRTAMGCVDAFPWERRDPFAQADTPTAPVFALETGGTPLAAFPFPREGLMIVGSEELGISPQALAAADASLGRVSIPCYGAKGSLNVSAAFAVAMQAWAASLAAIPCGEEPPPTDRRLLQK